MNIRKIIRRLLQNGRIKYLRFKYKGDLIVKPDVYIDPKSKIYPIKGKIILHSNVTINSTPDGYQAGMPFSACLLTDIENSLIEIGTSTRINGAYIHSQREITIGRNCLIAAGVHIIDSNGHVVNSNNRTLGRDKPGIINIGNNVWIGLNCIILKNTVIGDNTIVSAGSVVQGNIPENVIITGNPAKVIKKLDIRK